MKTVILGANGTNGARCRDLVYGEFLATGETVRTRMVATRGELTAQVAQIARAGPRRTLEPEIGTRLFISPRTIQYPLRKVLIKLDISSRNELDRVLPRDPATVPPL